MSASEDYQSQSSFIDTEYCHWQISPDLKLSRAHELSCSPLPPIVFWQPSASHKYFNTKATESKQALTSISLEEDIS